jgi:GDPmannose 4,6-dehydratase
VSKIIKKRALITGITGQDGSYLTEYLLDMNYEVHGIMRRSSTFTTERIDHLINDPRVRLHLGDLNDSSNIHRLVDEVRPQEIYHLGAQSHVGVSFEVPEYTGDVSGLGTLRILNAVKSIDPGIKFYNAATSEMFGGIPGSQPQNEKTNFHPRSPYGAAKLYAFWLCVNYREAFNLFIANGILFNHESPRRGGTFVTKKISAGVAKYIKDQDFVLSLGNLDSVRDWGFAGDYVKAMHSMLQFPQADDFVVATGIGTTVRQFVEMAYEVVDIKIKWDGEGDKEVGVNSLNGQTVIKVDPRFYRPSEVDVLIGDYSKAKSQLGWAPKTNVSELAKMMVESELKNS